MHRAYHPNSILPDHVGEDRSCLLQALNAVAYVGDDRALLQIIARLLQLGFNPRLHRTHEIGNMTRQGVAFLQRFDGGFDCAATGVADYHDQLGAEDSGAELQAPQTVGRDKVSCHADHEQVT